MKLQGMRHNKRRTIIQLLLELTTNKHEAIYATNHNGNKHQTVSMLITRLQQTTNLLRNLNTNSKDNLENIKAHNLQFLSYKKFAVKPNMNRNTSATYLIILRKT